MSSLPRWTHIALRVRDIEASIEFYTRHTPLRLLVRREDENGFGAWLGHDDAPEHPFILVLASFLPDRDPYADSEPAALGPFAHLGIELESRDDVDAIAATAAQLPPPIGYVCMVKDPDGNTIEFSYGQEVFSFAREHMRRPDPT